MSAIIKQAANFRPMSEQDLSQVLAIEALNYAYPWSRTIFRDCLRVGYNCWLLEHEDVVSGYGVMSVAVGESHILNLCVHPALQGQGYGHGLLDFLLELAREHKADSAFLEVRPSNEPALRLYQRAGFAEVGLRRDYYPARNGREDAIIMACSL